MWFVAVKVKTASVIGSPISFLFRAFQVQSRAPELQSWVRHPAAVGTVTLLHGDSSPECSPGRRIRAKMTLPPPPCPSSPCAWGAVALPFPTLPLASTAAAGTLLNPEFWVLEVLLSAEAVPFSDLLGSPEPVHCCTSGAQTVPLWCHDLP